MKLRDSIIFGGGWKASRSVRIQLKAWISLFLAIASGGFGIHFFDHSQVYGFLPAVFLLWVAVFLFICEPATTVELPVRSVGRNPRNLYSTRNR